MAGGKPFTVAPPAFLLLQNPMNYAPYTSLFSEWTETLLPSVEASLRGRMGEGSSQLQPELLVC